MRSKAISISNREARRLALQASGIAQKHPFGQGLAAVRKMITHLGYIQIDSISVVARAHHHAIKTRSPGYREFHLSKLHTSAQILEYWHHAAAYLPMEHFRYTLPLKQFFNDQKDRWPKSDPRVRTEVYNLILKEGPKLSRDFATNRDPKGTGWWDWKPAKLALERMFFAGDLICIGRVGFQKIYDVAERAIPEWIDKSMPTPEEYAQHVIDCALQRFGLTTIKETTYLLKVHRDAVKSKWDEMISDGLLQQVLVGKEKHPYYWAGEPTTTRISKIVRILSPFDPLVIQRERLASLFDFDYQLECYLPKHKRQRGYLALPLLYGDQFIGSMDAKADRSQKKLLIQNLLIERPLDLAGKEKLKHAIEEFAIFNDCRRIEVVKSNMDMTDLEQ